MESSEFTILVLNLFLGLGLARPLARRLSATEGFRHAPGRYYLLLVFVYLLEAFAFAASMSTSLLSLVLAVVWGILLGRRFRRARLPAGASRKIAFRFAFYTSLPAASFLSVPLVMTLGGWSVLSTDDGIRFGIPVSLPWPLNTILGFCLAVGLLTVICKVVMTTGIVQHMTRHVE